MIRQDTTYLRRQGANFLALINDLKRNRQSAAEELKIPLEQLEKIISGEIDIPLDVIDRATEIWPVNRRDFMILENDIPEGALVMRREASQASSRIFARGGFDYYEYRDTAMSRMAAFRPEWILQLCEVDDNDPENPHVQWNHGHFMHQFTLFINAVNYYYMEDGEKKVMIANTGDSMYITPFTAHSFTTRQEDSRCLYQGKKGWILALTYGNKLMGDPQQELSVLGDETAPRYLHDTTSRKKYFASLLKQQMASLTLSEKDLKRLAGFSKERMTQFIKGESLPTSKEYRNLSEALHINSRDLMPPDQFDPKVISCYLKDSLSRKFENYRITELAMVRYLPFSKSLILEIEEPSKKTNLIVPLHQYCYNFSSEPIRLEWETAGAERETILYPDDSVYLKPYIPHSFSPMGKAKPRLLSLRIGGKMTGEAQRELSHIGSQNLKRVYEEYTLWYREETRKETDLDESHYSCSRARESA